MVASPSNQFRKSNFKLARTNYMRGAARNFMNDEYRAESTEEPSPEALEQLRALGYAD